MNDNAKHFDGEFHEFRVFKHRLTTAEIDQIRAGTYSSGRAKKMSDDAKLLRVKILAAVVVAVVGVFLLVGCAPFKAAPEAPRAWNVPKYNIINCNSEDLEKVKKLGGITQIIKNEVSTKVDKKQSAEAKSEFSATVDTMP